MPKVLYVSHTARIGGAEHSLLDLIAGLPQHYAPMAACPEGPLADELTRRGVSVSTIDLVRFKRTLCPACLAGYWLAWRRGVRSIAGIISEEGVDLVHANSTTAHLYAGAAAARAGVPSVWHVRDTSVPAAARRLLRKADACIAISRYVAECVRGGGCAEPMVIYNGVDLEVFHPASGPRQPLVAMVGQLVPWKNHADFIRAAATVAKEVPASRFLIVGSDLFGDHPDYPARLESLARELGVAGCLEFTGHREDVAELLRTLAVMVLPSRGEPFGRVAAEAMASAVPVVAYAEGGPAEIVEHERTGILVPPGDVSGLAAGVVRLLRDPAQARRMGEAGRARAAEMFDCRRTAREVAAVYDSLLGGRE